MRTTTTKTLSGIAAVAAAGFAVVGLASPASAHHPNVDGEAVCNEETGKFDVTWTIGNSERHKVMTFTTSRDSVPGGTVEESGTVTRTEEVGPGSYELTVHGEWPKHGKVSRTASVEAAGPCEKASPSPSPSETAEPSETPEPSDDETTSVPPATGPATTEPPAEDPTTTEAADEPTKAGPAFPENGPGGDGAGPTDGVPTRIPAGGVGEDEIEAASNTTDAVGQPVVLGLVGLGAGLAAIGGVIGALRVRARQD